jgi:hypothetical protein
MKNQIIAIVFAVIAYSQLAVEKTHAQSRGECVPKNGYWVLVSNLNVKKVTTVQFYTNEHELIYEEVVRNHKLDLKRLKTLRCLKRGLDSALVAWNQEKSPLYTKDWVAVNMKH